MKEAIAYYRVSTDLQRDEGTIQIQQMKVREFASKQGYEIIGEFFDDGVSGGLRHRSGLNQLLAALQDTPAQYVIIYKLDRLARDLYIQEGLIQEFNRLNKQIVSTLEPDLDSTDPFRKAFRQMLGVFSEFEKAMIALRLEGGRERKARLGGWHGGNIFGYKNAEGKLEIDPVESETVKLIFKLRRQHAPYRTIARELNTQGHKTKRVKTKWSGTAIRKIYKNPIYKTGKIRYKGELHNSTTPPIV
jgi:site-specific DNA recombinase